MENLTDAEKVIKGLHDICSVVVDKLGIKQSQAYMHTIDDAIAILREQKTIIQCKDCKYCGKERIDRNMVWCNLHNFARPELYFCADGINHKN
jgi:hypothetical protein